MTSHSQFSLFDEELGKSTKVVEVLTGGRPTDKAHEAFRRLVSQIERRRDLLKRWQDYTVRYTQRVASELLPLQKEFRQVRRKMAFLLDELLGQRHGRLAKSQWRKVRQLLIELADDLLVEEADAELEALHDKHSDVTHADARNEDMAFSRAMMEDVLGADLGDAHDARSMEELFAKAQQELRDGVGKAGRKDTANQFSARASRKAEAAQARREQAAKEISQSVRDVYRKLASALHPDRETDATLRQRKTEQMKRVNHAYETGDLLELLNLQLEIEQIDATHLASIPQQRLKHYNQVLRDQLAELDAEIQALKMPFQMMPTGTPGGALTPEAVDRSLSAEIARTRLDIEATKTDLAKFRDPTALKQILRDYRPESAAMDDLADLALLADLLNLPVGKPRAKRRKKTRY